MANHSNSGNNGRRWLPALPLIVFGGLAALFLIQLGSGRDLAEVPSALIGQPAPATSLPPLEGASLPGLDSQTFKGKVTLVNVWASWCAPCREEHPVLMALSEDSRILLAGMNYKDQPRNALAFLDTLGNPFAAIGVDLKGRAAIDWGVYGVPETFVVGKDGTIRLRHVGPLSERALAETLLPEIEDALAP